MMSLNFIMLLIFLFLSSCALRQECLPGDVKVRNTDLYRPVSSVQKFFLPDIPPWSNFSTSGQCLRKKNMRYFDLLALQRNYNYTYAQAIEFQLLFNVDERLEKSEGLSPRDEEDLFFKTNDKIMAKAFAFNPPTFSRLHIVWIDPLLQSPNALGRLIQSNSMDLGVPIFVSLCLSALEMESWILQNQLENLGAKLISSEFFSIYSADGIIKPALHLNIFEFLGKEKKYVFFIPQGHQLPVELSENLKGITLKSF